MPKRHCYSSSSGRGHLCISLAPHEVMSIAAVTSRMGATSKADVLRMALRYWFEHTAPDLLSVDCFTQKQTKARFAWPTFHADVRAWIDGVPLSMFVKPGLSEKALYVRFRVYAKEQGWIAVSQRETRHQNHKAVIARWLASDMPKGRTRVIAQAILDSASRFEAARTANVSRQRIEQVIRSARLEMGEMAQTVDGFPVKDRQPVPFERYLDGRVWQLREGEDFSGSRENVAQSAYLFAKRRGLVAKSQRDRVDPKVMYLQFVKLVAPDHSGTPAAEHS